MIGLTERPDGVVLPIRAQPGARRSGIIGEHNGALKVAVTAPPEAGRANAALIETLRSALSLKRSQCQIIAGETARDKKVLITGIEKSKLAAMIDLILINS